MEKIKIGVMGSAADLNYSMEGIIRRRRAYEVLKDHLDALKID